MKQKMIPAFLVLIVINFACQLEPSSGAIQKKSPPSITVSSKLSTSGSDYDSYGESVAIGDFDGDGYGDTAVGIPHKTVYSVDHQGVVEVTDFFGEKEYWYMEKITGTKDVTTLSAFGSSLTVGDFNNDGLDDLAIGAPEYKGGSVFVIYAKSDNSGLSADNYSLITPGSNGYKDINGFGFSTSMAVGDMNGDGIDDLAIGQTGYGCYGSVMIVQGRTGFGLSPGIAVNGFTFYDDILIPQNMLIDEYNANNKFGFSLAFGYFDNDKFEDLAIGAPGNIVNNRIAGSVFIVYGASSILFGTTPSRTAVWHQNSTGIKGGCEAFDEFGFSLAAGNFDNKNNDDLAIGIPGENSDGGFVAVLYSDSNDLSANDILWSQNTSGIHGALEGGDRFGYSLAAADFNNDNYDDLIIGAPFETLSTSSTDYINAGCLHVLLGSSSGLTTQGCQIIKKGQGGIAGTLRSHTLFGKVIATGYFNSGNYADVFIGTPNDSTGGMNTGSAHLIYGNSKGLSTNNLIFRM